ncbi:MAG: hypothetical protein AAF889_08830, partial [Cyanobacteria bacterium P01_D01_bin.73]
MTVSKRAAIAAPKPPPAKKQPTLVVLDLGNYQCTTYDGKEFITIRSLFVELKPGQSALKVSAGSPLIGLGKRRFHVGRKATEYSGYRAVVSSDKTAVAEVFLAATMPVIEGDEIDLVILHHSHAQVAETLKERLTGVFSFTRNGKVHAVNITSVMVMDEAVGAFHLLDNPTGRTMGIDIGAGTYLVRIWGPDGETLAETTADKAGVYRLAVDVARDQRLRGPL